MKNLIVGIVLCVFPMFIWGQSADLDSLDRWIGGFPTAVKLDLLESMRDDVDRHNNVGERYQFARQLMEYGRTRADTLVWQYGLEWLADAFQANGEQDKAREVRHSLRQLGVSYGWPLDMGYPRVKAPYGYRYQVLSHQLAILQDASAGLSAEQVINMAGAGNFTQNDLTERGFRHEMTYWVKVKLRGPEREAGTFTFVPGSGYGPDGQLYSWDSIDVFVDYGNDSLLHRQTGMALAPSERPVRDAYPFFSLPLTRGQKATLYLRLRGGSPQAGSNRIFLEMVDRSSMHEWDGYRVPAFSEFNFPEGHATRTRRVARSLELLVDDTDELSFSNIWGEWEERAVMNAWQIDNWDQIFWVRMRLFGSDEGAGPVLLQFPQQQAWDSVEVYWPNEEHRYVRQWMGRSTPRWQRPLPHWQNLLRLYVGPNDTTDVYFRLRGYAGDRAERQIRIEQVWEDSYWPTQSYDTFIHGTLLGMLLLAFLFSLVLSMIRANWTLGWFALFILGLLVLVLFRFPENNGAVLWPSGAGSFHLVAMAGGWFCLVALTRYVLGMLGISRLAPAMARWAYFGLALWSLATLFYFGVSLGYLEGSGVQMLNYYLIPGLALILLMTLVVMTMYAVNEGSDRAWLMLIALTFAAIGGILAGAHFAAFGGLSFSDPVLWVALLSGWMALIFLFVANSAVGEDED